MMGRTHSLSSACLFLGCYPLLEKMGMATDSLPDVVAATVVATGAGMLPDFDHASATIAQSLGPITGGVARIVSALSGGHRNGTHSLLGVGVFTLLGVGASFLKGWPLGIVLGFMFAITLMAFHQKVVKITFVHTVLVISATIAFCTGSQADLINPSWIPFAFATGCIAHILGDMLTKEGCPLLYPFNKTRYHFLSLTTGQWWETWLLTGVLTLAVLALIAYRSDFLYLELPEISFLPDFNWSGAWEWLKETLS
jgi:membrane-bound metal-dependent hydrolase YbcI (DUF457 family)